MKRREIYLAILFFLMLVAIFIVSIHYFDNSPIEIFRKVKNSNFTERGFALPKNYVAIFMVCVIFPIYFLSLLFFFIQGKIAQKKKLAKLF